MVGDFQTLTNVQNRLQMYIYQITMKTENRKLNNHNTHRVSPTTEPNHTQQNQKKFHFFAEISNFETVFQFFLSTVSSTVN